MLTPDTVSRLHCRLGQALAPVMDLAKELFAHEPEEAREVSFSTSRLLDHNLSLSPYFYLCLVPRHRS